MKIIEGIVIRKINDKIIGMLTNNVKVDFSGIIELNETGYKVWQGIEKGLTVDEIANEFVSEYDITFDKALESVNKVVDELKKEGIVID